MVFHCRCFSLSFVEEEKEIEYDTTTPTKSSSNQTFYTASSDFNRSISDSQTTRSDFSNLNEKSTNLRVFTVAELKEATGNFCESSKIGDGRFGSVHKGTIESSEYPFHEIQVAVKHANGRLLGQEDWLSKAIHFGVVEHPNLVKLIGYCAEDDEFGTHHLLVYEYMPNRSVADHLSMRTNTPLSWTMRLKVAQDVARGLAYLHERMDVLNIFGDFKSSNILLDDQWNAKLSDFGLTHINVSTPLFIEIEQFLEGPWFGGTISTTFSFRFQLFVEIEQFLERPRFGGTFSTTFPLRFQDVSNIHHVHDHQYCIKEIHSYGENLCGSHSSAFRLSYETQVYFRGSCPSEQICSTIGYSVLCLLD